MKVDRTEVLALKENSFKNYLTTIVVKYNELARDFNATKKFWQRKKPIVSERQIVDEISKVDFDNGFNYATLWFLAQIEKENEMYEFLRSGSEKK